MSRAAVRSCMHALTIALFVFGYPMSIAIIARWVPVVRERRLSWFIVHEAAVASIVAGWAIRERWSAVTINGSWFVVAAAWYAIAARRLVENSADH